jgi:hypothetical protein
MDKPRLWGPLGRKLSQFFLFFVWAGKTEVFSGNKLITYYQQTFPINQQTITTAREQMNYSLSINYYHREASLWAENCPNFLAGTSPKGALWAENCPNFFFFLFGPGKLKFSQGINQELIINKQTFPINQQTITTAREQMNYSLSINYYHREAAGLF